MQVKNSTRIHWNVENIPLYWTKEYVWVPCIVNIQQHACFFLERGVRLVKNPTHQDGRHATGLRLNILPYYLPLPEAIFYIRNHNMVTIDYCATCVYNYQIIFEKSLTDSAITVENRSTSETKWRATFERTSTLCDKQTLLRDPRATACLRFLSAGSRSFHRYPNAQRTLRVTRPEEMRI
jgi:hypothetical protein